MAWKVRRRSVSYDYGHGRKPTKLGVGLVIRRTASGNQGEKWIDLLLADVDRKYCI